MGNDDGITIMFEHGSDPRIIERDVWGCDWIDLGHGSYIRFANRVAETESKIKKVIFNDPATIILWKNGTKTVVKCGEGETYDPEKGLAMCLVKNLLGNKGNYYNLFKKYLKEVK